jgi:DNA-binding NarL/FixJ family response regulator
MGRVAIRILLVDDFASWRRRACSLLATIPGWRVVGEASDGLEAIWKAERLKLDIILLDISLPKMNGIEAARHIRKVAPASKVIFVSQTLDRDVVREALRIGSGYVAKQDAGSELVAAIQAVAKGSHFVSVSARGLVHFDPEKKTESAELAKTSNAYFHEVQFYADDGCFLDGLAQFIGAALRGGNAAITVLSESHHNVLLSKLQAEHLDIAAAIDEGRYVFAKPADTLAKFMVGDVVDEARFTEIFVDFIASAAMAVKVEHPRVAVCGQIAPFLWAQGKVEEAIRIERLSDELVRKHNVDLLCGYPASSFRPEDKGVLDKICGEHSFVHFR